MVQFTTGIVPQFRRDNTERMSRPLDAGQDFGQARVGANALGPPCARRGPETRPSLLVARRPTTSPPNASGSPAVRRRDSWAVGRATHPAGPGPSPIAHGPPWGRPVEGGSGSPVVRGHPVHRAGGGRHQHRRPAHRHRSRPSRGHGQRGRPLGSRPAGTDDPGPPQTGGPFSPRTSCRSWPYLARRRRGTRPSWPRLHESAHDILL